MKRLALIAALALGGCSTTPPPRPMAPLPPPPLMPVEPAAAVPDGVPPGAMPPKAMLWLYGSAEADALTRQSYNALVSFVEGKIADRRAGRPVGSAVLAPGATLDQPTTVACGAKPLAVMLDVDETVLLNLGFEYDDARHGGSTAWDDSRWERWERTGADKVTALPGAREAFAQLRGAGVTILFNSNRSNANAAFTARALEGAGVGPAVPLDTLWLKGDVAPGSGKDPRRLKASEKYCIVALAGDQLGDFSDLFSGLLKDVTARRAAADKPSIAGWWGAGWFVMPNPIYGTGTIGGWDAAFPADKRWNGDVK